MNIKKRISKFISLLLSFTITFGNVIPAYAMENTSGASTAAIEGENISIDERDLEDVKVTYRQASSFFVTIPKTIVLDGGKQSTYSVKVSGDIDAEQCVYVAPIDGIAKTENIDFYMKDQTPENAKDDVVANITHNKSHWNSAEVAEGYIQDDNLVSAQGLTAGAWKGIFQTEIKLETHVVHKHNYVATITKEPTCTEKGVKTYTCDCGNSYIERIPVKGHHYGDDDKCTGCGELKPSHVHSYIGTITKEPTCTEAGEKTYTCKCGESYTEELPAKGHHYGDNDKCTGCGELKPSHVHSYIGTIIKEPTCTEKGVKTYTCKCGDSYTEELPAKGHHYESGKCTNCGKIDPSHTHSYDEGEVTKEPTCAEKGEKTFTCSGCGHTYIEEIDTKEHDYGVIVPFENTSNGTYKFVQNGNKWTSNNKGVQSSTATSTWIITLAKDAEYSFKYKVSSEDRYDKLTITLDSTTVADAISGAGTEQTYTTTLTAGTHTLTASYVKDSSQNKNDDCGYVILEDIVTSSYKCQNCGEIDPSHTHSYNEGVVTKEPTCTEKGEKTFTCLGCGNSYTEDVDVLGHDYLDNSVWENTSNGSYAFVKEGTKWTSNNGGVQSSTATSTWKIAVAEDTEYSFKYKVSSEANYDKLTITLDSTTVANAISGAGTEQTYTTTLTAGTHTLTASFVKDGSGDKNDDCGYVILEDIVKVIINEPTCTEKGGKTFTCSRCGYNYTEEIPAKGHHYGDDDKCTGCGELNPSHVHNYVNGTITKEPACIEKGVKTYTCKCGDSYTEEIPAKGHHYGDDDKCTGCGELNPDHRHSYTETITKEPTCTEKGEKTYTCTCGHSYTEGLPAKGHNFSGTTCTTCGKIDLYAVAPATAYSNWNYTLNDTNNIITLNYYIGSEADVIVYGKYTINGKIYKTQIASNADDATNATPYMFNAIAQTNCGNIKSVKFSPSIDTRNVTNMRCMFAYCKSLTNIDVSSLNTGNVRNMSWMFFMGYNSKSPLKNLDVSNFDTSNVTDMQNMFNGCSSLSVLDVSNFNTRNVTNMAGMFEYCLGLTSLDLSNFDTRNVTNMQGMFDMFDNDLDSSLTYLNVSSFDTSNVTNMNSMFEYCELLTRLDLSNFDTSNVTNMNAMFFGCYALISLDVSSFDTSNVTNMAYMFYDCYALTSLDLSSFDTSKVTDMERMFAYSRNLKTIYVTEGKWVTSQADTSWMLSDCGTSTVTYK